MDLQLLADVAADIKMENPNLLAMREAVKTGSILPLTKRIMHDTIQLRRMKRGQSELKLEPTKAKKLKLTEEDRLRIEKRKESNRISAVKYRQNQRKIKEELIKRNDQLERELKMKDAKIQLLESEKRRLHICFDWRSHETFCSNPACKMVFEE